MADEIKKTQAEEMDWDSGISSEAGDNEYKIPEVGEYGFQVIEFEKTLSKAGKKMAKLKIKLDSDGYGCHIYDYLVLSANMEWKLATFFESLGLKQKGEPLNKMPWDKVLGAFGRVKIKHEIYEGEERCKVDRYIPSASSSAPTKPTESNLPFEV